MTDELYQAIRAAERAAYHAYNLSYAEKTPFRVRANLGRAQNILMSYVVKYERAQNP